MNHEILGLRGRGVRHPHAAPRFDALDDAVSLDVAQKMYPRAQQPWLDLSTSLNSVAYRVAPLPPESWERQPSAVDLERLEEAAAQRYGAASGVRAVAAPGTRALIQRLPDLMEGPDVRLLGQGLGAFEAAFRADGRTIKSVPRAEALSGADVAIVVNPNNPDGRLVPSETLLDLAPRVGTLVVDETFMDALPPGHSLVPRLPSPRILVLRSFGVMHGLAGLRLAFALGSGPLVEALRRVLGPCPVSGPAIAVGRAALADAAWLEATRARLAGDAARLMFLMRQVGADVVGGTPLFRLLAHPGAGEMFEALAEAGILTRGFARQPSWLRMSYPSDEAGWARLEVALRDFR